MESDSLAKLSGGVNCEEESYTPSEKLDRLADALVEVYLRLPAEDFLGAGDVGLSHFGIVHGKWFLLDRASRSGDAKDFLAELSDRHFARVADVHRLVKIRHHQTENSIDQVGDIAEAAGLRTVAENREWLAGEGLADERRHHTAIIEAHAGAISVEDSDDVGVHPVVAVVGHCDGLREALCLVINATRSDGVHIAPIILGLRVDERVTITLGGGGENECRAFVLREAKRVVRAERADLERRDRNP